MRLALALALLISLTACQDIKQLGGGTGLDLPGLGVVYQCDTETGDRLELCWDSGAQSLSDSLAEHGYGSTFCYPTPRHLGPCRWCTGGRGCNAFNGCWGCE